MRAVKWCATQQELASVSTAGTLTLWDGQLRQQRQVSYRWCFLPILLFVLLRCDSAAQT